DAGIKANPCGIFGAEPGAERGQELHVSGSKTSKSEWKKEHRRPNQPPAACSHESFTATTDCVKYDGGSGGTEGQGIRNASALQIGDTGDQADNDGDCVRDVHKYLQEEQPGHGGTHAS